MQASSFVGRERELDELEEMLASSRLLTLTGPGGSGKTRLGLQAAARIAEEFEDGVGFVELAHLSAAEPVAEGVARALGVRWGAGLSPAGALMDHLGPSEMLLLLDNCEHLIEGCAELANACGRAGRGALCVSDLLPPRRPFPSAHGRQPGRLAPTPTDASKARVVTLLSTPSGLWSS